MGAVRPITVSNTLSSNYNWTYPNFVLDLGGTNRVSYFGVTQWGTVELNAQNIRTGIPSSMSKYAYSPVIYVFWAEVSDLTRPTYGNAIVDGRKAFVVNWTNVRYTRSSDATLTNTFQIVIYGEPSNALTFEMNYDKIQWEMGNTGLFPPGAEMVPGELAPALVGYRINTKDRWQKSGSLEPGGLLDSNLDTGLIHNSRNSDVSGRYVYTLTAGGIESEQDDASDEVGNRRWFARQVGA